MSRYLNQRYGELKAYVPGAQPKVENLIKLNTNESPYPPSPKVAAAVAEAATGLNRYPDLSAKSLISLICAQNGVEANQVIVGNGSDEILAFAMMAFGGSGARFADITYGFYPVWADLFGMEKKIIPLQADFSVQVSDYQDDPAMILLANPNAPTGLHLSPLEIEAVIFQNPSCVVVVDEAYYGFGAETCAHLIKRHKNLLVVRTLSKAYALAGARVGYAMGDAALIEDLNKIRYSFHPYNLGTLPMAAAAAAISDVAYYEKLWNRITSCREDTAVKLREMGFNVIPSMTNFLFAKHEKASGPDVQSLLAKGNIYIRRFEQPRISDFLRITIGDEAQMGKVLEVLKGGLPS